MLARKRWIPILLAVAAAAVIWRCRAGDDAGAPRGDARARRALAPAPLHFRDGRWVRLDGDELRRVLHELATRRPGLIRVSGTVRSAETDEPVPGAEVVFAGPAGESSTTADDAGSYTIEVAPGLYRAFARADGFVAVGTPQPERLPGQPDADTMGMPRGELAPVLAVFRDQRGVDMHLHRGAEISGTVYDASGRPVSGAVVAGLQGMRRSLILGTDMDETDLDGSFRIDVPAGGVGLEASHEDFAGIAPTSTTFLFLAPGERARVDLTLVAGCIIRGRVVDRDGRAVGEGSLEAHAGGSPPNDYAPVGRVDAEGRFVLTRTEPGTVRLRAWPWKSPHTAPHEISCSDGARYDDVTFVVPDADPDLEGSLWTADGEPVAGAYVDIQPVIPGGMAQQERADAYGEWAVYAVPPGEYQVMAYVPGKGAAVATVTAPSRGVRLTLSGTGAISGSALGMESGSFTFEVVRCLLRAEDGGMARFDEYSMPRTRRIVSVEGGRFDIDEVPACPIQALVRSGLRVERVQVTVERDRAVPLELDLRAPRRVRVYGVVTGPDGTAQSGAVVFRIADSEGPRGPRESANTDEEGRYEIDALTGERLVVISDAGRAFADVTWTDDPELRIDVALSGE